MAESRCGAAGWDNREGDNHARPGAGRMRGDE